jgi:hypothetical protein
MRIAHLRIHNHRSGYGFRACTPTGYRRPEHIYDAQLRIGE